MDLNTLETTPERNEHQQFIDCYAENLIVLMDSLEAVSCELAQVGDYQAASFFDGVSRVISAFAATHFPMARLLDVPRNR